VRRAAHYREKCDSTVNSICEELTAVGCDAFKRKLESKQLSLVQCAGLQEERAQIVRELQAAHPEPLVVGEDAWARLAEWKGPRVGSPNARTTAVMFLPYDHAGSGLGQALIGLAGSRDSNEAEIIVVPMPGSSPESRQAAAVAMASQASGTFRAVHAVLLSGIGKQGSEELSSGVPMENLESSLELARIFGVTGPALFVNGVQETRINETEEIRRTIQAAASSLDGQRGER
jgi:hypothetical protein